MIFPWINKPHCYGGLVDVIINKKYIDQIDNLFQALNINDPKNRYAIKMNPDNYIDEMKRNVKFDGKKIQALKKNLNHLDI